MRMMSQQMSRRDVVISKLSDTMDPDNARALLNEVIREQRQDGTDEAIKAIEHELTWRTHQRDELLSALKAIIEDVSREDLFDAIPATFIYNAEAAIAKAGGK
jgi:predicted transcriptional regulator